MSIVLIFWPLILFVILCIIIGFMRSIGSSKSLLSSYLLVLITAAILIYLSRDSGRDLCRIDGGPACPPLSLPDYLKQVLIWTALGIPITYLGVLLKKLIRG